MRFCRITTSHLKIALHTQIKILLTSSFCYIIKPLNTYHQPPTNTHFQGSLNNAPKTSSQSAKLCKQPLVRHSPRLYIYIYIYMPVVQLVKNVPNLWNPKVYYFVHTSPLLVPTLTQINGVYTTPSRLSKIHFIITQPPTSWSSQWPPSFRISH
jgi:hypothetical protein